MALTKDKVIEFAGFSRAETKRGLQNYFNAAISLSKQVSDWVLEMVMKYSPQTVSVVMEMPFDGSYASSGLWMLQCAILTKLRYVYRELEDSGDIEDIVHYALTPSYISGQIKKVCNKKDGIGIRKTWCSETLTSLLSQGYKVVNPSELKASGNDRQTAFGFWYFLSHSDKELEPFMFEE